MRWRWCDPTPVERALKYTEHLDAAFSIDVSVGSASAAATCVGVGGSCRDAPRRQARVLQSTKHLNAALRTATSVDSASAAGTCVGVGAPATRAAVVTVLLLATRARLADAGGARQPGNGGLHALPALPTDLWICVLKLVPMHELGCAAGAGATTPAATLAAEVTQLQRQLAVERAGSGSLRESNGGLQEENGGLREEVGGLRAKADQLEEEVGWLRAQTDRMKEEVARLRAAALPSTE